MTTTEKLQAIRAKCEALLTAWNGKRDHNPIYQAACGKESEAGWRATIAAIDFITEFRRTKWGWDGDCGVGAYTDNLEDEILTAWSHLFTESP